MGVSFLDNIVKKIQNQLNIVGIKLNFKQVDPDIFYSDIYYNGENHSFDMLLHAWAGNPYFEKGEMYVSEINSISNVPTEKNNFSGENISAYENEQFNYLFVKLNRVATQEERNAILREMSQFFIDEIIAIPLCYRVSKIYHSKGVDIHTNAFLGNYTNKL